jgi:hypothetical protein
MLRRSSQVQWFVRSLVLVSLVSLTAPDLAIAADPDPKDAATRQLKAELDLLKTYDNECASSYAAAQDRAVDVAGSIEEKMQSRPKGELSIREKRALTRIEAEVDTQALLVSECYKKVNARRNEIAVILSNPERLQAFGTALLEQQKREVATREAAQAAAQARQAYVEQELRATIRSLVNETKRLADTVLASAEPAQALIARAAEVQGRQRATATRLRGVALKPADRQLLEQVGKTWVHLNEALQATRREEAAASDLASLQTQHAQARRRLAAQNTMLDRANFDQLTQTLQSAESASKDAKNTGELRRGALRAAINDMTQVAEASQ